MAELDAGRKIIAVSNGTERATYFLRRILGNSGIGAYTVTMAQRAVERGETVSVLLTGDAPEFPVPALSRTCVMRFEPDRQKPPGFQNVVTYSTKWDCADFTARNIRQLPNGTTAFEIVGVGIIGRARLGEGLGGDVEAALAAAAAAMAAGMPFAEVLKALNGSDERIDPCSGRTEDKEC